MEYNGQILRGGNQHIRDSVYHKTRLQVLVQPMLGNVNWVSVRSI